MIRSLQLLGVWTLWMSGVCPTGSIAPLALRRQRIGLTLAIDDWTICPEADPTRPSRPGATDGKTSAILMGTAGKRIPFGGKDSGVPQEGSTLLAAKRGDDIVVRHEGDKLPGAAVFRNVF
jgi:hypothetical protein